MEYVGEIITAEEGNIRGMKYDADGMTYMFDLDYAQDDEPYKYTIDATKFGNVSHFVNHSVSYFNSKKIFFNHFAFSVIQILKR